MSNYIDFILKEKKHLKIEIQEGTMQPTIIVPRESITELMSFLKNNEKLFFDYLESISGVDYGPKENKMEVVYHLQSIPYGYFIVVKTPIVRQEANEELPWTYSVVDIWKGANWHEREIYDLFGIYFKNHPNMKRIFMPEDWKGFPMRKDYVQFPEYKGIKCLTENPEKGGKVSF